MIPSINVILWGKHVGTLVETGSGRNRQICFYFDIKGARKILDTAREAVEIFAEHANTAGLIPDVIDLIMQNHNVG